jgi:hypothetical protein
MFAIILRDYIIIFMSVEFEEFKVDEIRRPRSAGTYLTDLIIKSGLVKSKGGANVVMIIISIVCIAIAIYFAI